MVKNRKLPADPTKGQEEKPPIPSLLPWNTRGGISASSRHCILVPGLASPLEDTSGVQGSDTTLTLEHAAGIRDFPSAPVLPLVSNFSAFAKRIWPLQKCKKATLQDGVRDRSTSLTVGENPLTTHSSGTFQGKRQNQPKLCQIHHPFSLRSSPNPLSTTTTLD